MSKILALNEDVDSNSSDGSEIQVTKEAEETIAVSEYMRALEFKKDEDLDSAKFLFTELLETQVLAEVDPDTKDNKLFYVKYNCFKNLGFIYEEKGDQMVALEFLLKAFDLDDTDVYTMNKLGQLALGMKQLDIAHEAFQKCLKRSPNHWPSGDGILKILCMRHDINQAYGWALDWYTKDAKYERGLDVILEIRNRFKSALEYIECHWKIKFKEEAKMREWHEGRPSVFPKSEPYVIERLKRPDIEKHQLKELTWSSFGKMIIDLYNTNDAGALSYGFDFDEILCKSENNKVSDLEAKDDNDSKQFDSDSDDKMDVDKERETDDGKNGNVNFVAPSTEPYQQTSAEQSAEDSEGNSKSEEGKVKRSRRRGSDLRFLEQWGWHKSKRYSKKKSDSETCKERDSTIGAFLRRVLGKYFEESFENESPFIADKTDDRDDALATKIVDSPKNDDITCEEFQKASEVDFNHFISSLKDKNFDIIELTFKWPQYISKYWETSIPKELREMFLQIYEFQLNHYDLCTWNLLDVADFQGIFRSTLFYLEQSLDKWFKTAKKTTKNDSESNWVVLYNHLLFQSGFGELADNDEEYRKLEKRIYWLQYCLAQYEWDLERAVNCLYSLEGLIEDEGKDYRLEITNLRHNNIMSLPIVQNLRINFERTISLNNVKNLYADGKFEELVVILKDSLINATEIKIGDTAVLKIQTQFEVLLEALYSLEKYDECFIWAERCLNYAVDNFINSSSWVIRQQDWAKTVNFILTYISSLIELETSTILNVLGKYVARLIQSLAKILSNQMDTTTEKSTQPHLLNVKNPVSILHQVLLRDEDQMSVMIRKQPSENASDSGDDDETIANSMMLFFVAHDFLGRRDCCTKDNGEFLHFVLDITATQLRSPMLEPFREVIVEYLEQATYCLYGYPAKRHRRTRHIEEHNAVNVELTWDRAIQLFDMYRPDDLSDFGSSNVSIEIEQLMQRMLKLIPGTFQEDKLTQGIRDFICGKSETTPEESDILPVQISCIYYLLACFYFKKREFSKASSLFLLDLAVKPTRHQSWAGLALSKVDNLDLKLNSGSVLNINEFVELSKEPLRCFEQWTLIEPSPDYIWIEYGTFAYTMHSFCSRSLKQSSDTLSMERFSFLEEHKEQFLNISFNCFTTVHKVTVNENPADEDEKWLHQYMIGKVAEKRKDPPKVTIDYYLKAANFLFENGATYPIKISHAKPQNLSIEAMEIFYRINTVIIKYLEQHKVVSRAIGKLFSRTLKDLSGSAFALNRAKLDDNSVNALKRKVSQNDESFANNNSKQMKMDDTKNIEETKSVEDQPQIKTDIVSNAEAVLMTNVKTPNEVKPSAELNVNKLSRPSTPAVNPANETPTSSKPGSPSRRGSQESTATTTTTTTTTTGTSDSTSVSSSSDSDSSSSDSDSSSTEDDSEKARANQDEPISESTLDALYQQCVKNLEECVTRFPEHFKSIYRLCNFYIHGPEKHRNLEKAKQLLLGTYTTVLGNQIRGLFLDRKANNFFADIWKSPSQELDRPGSFSAHITKSVVILMEVLRMSSDHKTLFELASHLIQPPTNDQYYIKESERKDLQQQAISFCVQVFRNLLKQHGTDKRDDVEMVNVIIEIFKTQKRCCRQLQSKEILFQSLLVDAYKIYIQPKVSTIPENTNLIDVANKFAQHEISKRRQLERGQFMPHSSGNLQDAILAGTVGKMPPPLPTPITPSTPPITPAAMSPITPVPVLATTAATTPLASAPQVTTPSSLPGQPRPRGRPPGSKSSNTAYPTSLPAAFNNPFLGSLDPLMAGIYGAATNQSANSFNDPGLKTFYGEYLKLLQSQLCPPPKAATKSPVPSATPKLPQFDINHLIKSATTSPSSSSNKKTSTTISLSGSNQLTITPTATSSPKSNASSRDNQKSNYTSIILENQRGHNVHSLPSATTVKPVSHKIDLPGISANMFHDMPEISVTSVKSKSIDHANLNLPDFPKHLTVTPSSSSPRQFATKSTGGNQRQKQSVAQPERPRYTEKQKKKQQLQTHPYSRGTGTGIPANLTQNALLSQIASSGVLNSGALTNLANPYHGDYQQMMLLNTYADFLKNSNNANFLQQLGSQLIPPELSKPAKAPKIKQPRAPKGSGLSVKSLKQLQQQPPQFQQKQNAKGQLPPPFALPDMNMFTMPNVNSPAPPAHSPSKSPLSSVMFPHKSHTPPVQSTSGPTKTLQQKLAERQKMNQASSQQAKHPKPPKLDDIIVLE